MAYRGFFTESYNYVSPFGFKQHVDFLIKLPMAYIGYLKLMRGAKK